PGTPPGAVAASGREPGREGGTAPDAGAAPYGHPGPGPAPRAPPTGLVGVPQPCSFTSATDLPPAQAAALPAPVRDGLRAAVTSGLHGVLLGTTPLAALACAAAWLVREIPPSRPGAAPEAAPEAPVATEAAPGSAAPRPEGRPAPRPS
ncbi:hypothetical protein ACWGI1_23445, partial [Streptomyces sp. NPDC054835]